MSTWLNWLVRKEEPRIQGDALPSGQDTPAQSQHTSADSGSAPVDYGQGSGNQSGVASGSLRSVSNNEQGHAGDLEITSPNMVEQVSHEIVSQPAGHSNARPIQPASDELETTGNSRPMSQSYRTLPAESNRTSDAFVNPSSSCNPASSIVSTSSKSHHRRPPSPSIDVQMISPSFDEDEILDVPGASLSETPQGRWGAFIRKHQNLTAALSEATQLRRLCLDLRMRSSFETIPLSNYLPQIDANDTQNLGVEFSTSDYTLQQLEMRLNELDEKIIRDSADTLRAAPRVLNMMQKRMPILLQRHQIDFRGDASTSDYMSNADFDEVLDPTAAKLLGKQRELDILEDDILMLKHERSRIIYNVQVDCGGNQSDSDADRQHLADLDQKINDAVSRLRTAQAELERSRDMSTTPVGEAGEAGEAGEVGEVGEVQDAPTFLSPQIAETGPAPTSITLSNAETLVAEDRFIPEKSKDPD